MLEDAHPICRVALVGDDGRLRQERIVYAYGQFFTDDGRLLGQPQILWERDAVGAVTWDSITVRDWYYVNCAELPRGNPALISTMQSPARITETGPSQTHLAPAEKPAPLSPAAPARPASSAPAAANGWYGTAVALTVVVWLMAVFYYPGLERGWPVAALLDVALQPIAWAAVVCGFVAQSKGRPGAGSRMLALWAAAGAASFLIGAVL